MIVRFMGFSIFLLGIQGCGPAIQVGPDKFDLAMPPETGVHCMAIEPLPPLADTVTIQIKPGTMVIADDGGETLLRQYAKISEAIRHGKLKRCSPQR